MMLFLGRKFSVRRWMAITLLMFGVAFVQMNNTPASEANKKRVSTENYFVGLSAVLATCVTAGFAGVYFEKMLKDGGSTPFWIRNMQMYSCGVVSFGCAQIPSTHLISFSDQCLHCVPHRFRKNFR